MASRQVKKLLQKQQEAALHANAAPPDDDSEAEEGLLNKAPFNPFDLLSDEDQGELEAVADEDKGEAESEQQKDKEQQATIKAQPVKAQKNAKKKKGSKKGKGSAAQEEADETSNNQAAAGTDDIDKLLQELNMQASSQAANDNVKQSGNAIKPTTTTSPMSQLLSVDTQALKGDEELKRIFGASIIAAVDREEVAEAANRRRQAAAMRGRPGAAAALRRAKKGLLVSPKDHWPIIMDSGISMEYTGVKDGVRHFKYKWSHSYINTQRAFHQCQASHDPNAIAALLQHAPFHVDSLLAMYDLYRHLGENQYAEEVLQRALHVLELAWHPQFDIRTANCRLSFEVAENRGLFVALFRHVHGLSRAGCHRTALEVAKLLLALEPEDPMGCLCMMDYLAVKAGRYEYLQQFVYGWEADTSLSLRPNYAYALPMAAFKLQQQRHQQQQASKQDVGSEELSPQQKLVQAILLQPSVVPKVIAKLQEKGAGRESHWSTLLSRPLFKKPHDEGSATLQHLAAIYVEKSALLWKAPDLLEFLRTCATRAADIHEAGNIKYSGSSTASGSQSSSVTKDDTGAELSAEDWACIRRETFPDDQGANEYRHLRLADFSDNVHALPREEMAAAVGAVGPPPNAAAPPHQRGRAAAAALPAGLQDADLDPAMMQIAQEQLEALQRLQQGDGRLTDQELQEGNPFYMFLRSLLPWVDAGQQPDYGADDEQHQSQQPEERQ